MPPNAPVILHDVPASQTALGFDRYAQTLANIIMSSRPRFAIGIFGGWGSGKTTLMKAIQERLDSPSVVKAEFSAWRYEREPNLIVPLLDAIREGLLLWAKANPSPAAKGSAKDAAATVGRVVKALLSTVTLKVGLPGAAELEIEAAKAIDSWREGGPADDETARSTYHAAFMTLTQTFASFAQEDPQRRIVVFVDDLDRCLPNGAVEVIEAMKLFFDLDGFVFVVGLDEKVVETSVEQRYRGFNAFSAGAGSEVAFRGADYIKKIFQVPFSLGPASVRDLPALIDIALEEANAPPDQRNDVRLRVIPHLNYVIEGDLINPRELKRYINAYTIQHAITPHLDRDAVLAIQSLRFRPEWHPLYRALLLYRHGFIEALRNTLGGAGGGSALDALDDELASVPADFLAYVGPGEPGAALVGVPNIGEYISAGEATKAEGNPRVIDAATRINNLRPQVRALPDRVDGAHAPVLNQVISTLQSARSMVGPDAGPSGRARQSAAAELERIASALDSVMSAISGGGPSQPLNGADLDLRLRQLVRALISTV